MDRISQIQLGNISGSNFYVADSRPLHLFIAGHIPGSVFLPLNENFSLYAEVLAMLANEFILITETGTEEEIAPRIVHSGEIEISAALEGGMQAWQKADAETDLIICIGMEEFELDYKYDEFYLIDLRSAEAFRESHLEDAENMPLTDLPEWLDELSADNLYYLYAACTDDAVFAASLFKRSGLHRLRVIEIGFDELLNSSIPKTIRKKGSDGSSFSNN